MVNYKLIYIIGFLLPLYSLSLRIGVEISLYKILPLVSIIVSILYLRNIKFYSGVLKYCLVLFLLFTLVTSIHYYIIYDNGFMHNAVRDGLTIAKAYYHMPTQLLAVTLLISNFFMMPNLINNEFSLNKFINGFIDGNIFSVIVGFLLVFMSYIGVNIDLIHVYQNRLSGLGGEPRHFSSLLVLSMMILVFNRRAEILTISNQTVKKAVLFFGIFFSLSTSSWIGFIIMILYYLITSGVKKFVSGIIVVAVINSIAYISSPDVFNERLIDRISNGYSQFVYYAPKDGLTLDLLTSNPISFIFGSGAGGSDYYITNTGVLENADNKIKNTLIIQAVINGERQATLSASSFIIRFVGDFGIFGLFLLVVLVLRLRRMINNSGAHKLYTDLSYTMFFAALVMSAISFHIYIILISAVLAVYAKNNYTR